jgi:hypothetical protein
MLRLREQHGWSSDLLKSPEWRQMKTDWAQLMLSKKNIEQLGAISGSDMELMTNALGASDPTAVQDPSEGIRRARHNTVQGFNSALTSKRRAGTPAPKSYRPPDLSHATKPVETDVDKARKKAIGRPVNPAEEIAQREGYTYKQPLHGKEWADAVVKGEDPGEFDKSTGGMDDETKAAIDALVAKDDIEGLQQAAVNANAPGARQYAMQKMVDASVARGAKSVAPPKPRGYTTQLSTADEAKFESWVKANRIPFDPSPTADYDMRGFWLAKQHGDKRAARADNGHFPDTWKTPHHKTFSNESIYATGDAPHWEGSKLVDKTGRVIADEGTK